MRKLNTFSAVLSLFLLVPASIIWAQTISSQKGLTTAVFPTQHGNVKVYLPDDVRPGAVISGTVVAEPTGNNPRQIEKNLSELSKFSVNVDGIKVVVAGQPISFKWLVPLDRQTTAPIELLNAAGVKAHELKYNIRTVMGADPVNYGCAIPSHALTDAPCRITGNFDGNAANTNCALNNQPMQVLAESPRQCIVQYPANGQGPGTMQVNENGEQKCTRQISGVDMQVITGKLNLRKGENTFIEVKITGLDNLPDKATLTIANMTTDVVTMTNGNLQVIPIWPPADSARGTFSVHCPAVSITTGNFVVNINLDLPEVMLSPEPGDNKDGKCNCSVTASIIKPTSINFRGFHATLKKNCSGQNCSEAGITKKWEIVSGKENVESSDISNNNESITIQPKGNGIFTLKFSVMLTCSDGSSCTDLKFINENGDEVKEPQEEDTNEPLETTESKNINQPGSSKCGCDGGCTIKKISTKGNEVKYEVEIKNICTGTYGSGSTRSVCEAGKPVYKWKIGASGKDVAEIEGKSDEKSATVKQKKAGQYNVYVYGTYKCTDGTECYFVCSIEQTVPPPSLVKACMPSLSHKVTPLMDGGVVNNYKGLKNTKSIRRDDFIVLEAAGADYDMAVPACEKMLDCPDNGCDKELPIAGRVRFEWEITTALNGTGSFVQIGCIPDDARFKGEHVIFKPPYVPLPVVNADTSITTTINLYIIDAGSPVGDPTVTKTITIVTKRTKTTPDFYTVDISGGAYTPAIGTDASKAGCACKPQGPTWLPGDNLVSPDIILPSASSNQNKLVQGQWIMLTTKDQSDKDLATYTCTSASSCPTATLEKSYDDIIHWKWKVEGGGRIILSDTSQYVVYEAPVDFKGKDSLDINITLSVYNPTGRADPKKDFTAEKILRIYKPGIRLNYPADTAWLPEEDNFVELKSELVYKSGKEWKPALDHMCRIQFFELMNVSQEKGICMNYPPEKADYCYDLQLKEDKNLEVFAPEIQAKEKCTLKEQYFQARSGMAVKEISIKVHSLDYGSYGFLRSFANINKGADKEPSFYYPVPWLKTEAFHPLRQHNREKKKEHTDNRVTVPYDVDENHVADKGWFTVGSKKVEDPPFVFNTAPDAKTLKDARRKGTDIPPDNDNEDIPVGDGFKGDGLGSYEEYRGFKVMADDKEVHTRTDYEVKDIFVCNENKFLLDLYQDVSGLNVYEINQLQFINTRKRMINFNYSANTHIVDQAGLYLVDRGKADKLMGLALSSNGKPTTPNFEVEIQIYTDNIKKHCETFKLDEKEKTAAVVAHELLHGNNVCHHGEGNEAVEKSHDLPQGLRSGDIYCVMHYDNSGFQRDINYIPEPIGTKLCSSNAGTGYNAPENKGKDKEKHLYFGPAAEGKGNCAGQLRVSGRGGQPTSCGNRYDDKGEIKREFKDKEP
jgi:hypothetical protein